MEEEMTPEQKACLNFIVSSCPKQIVRSPVIVDVFDNSQSHIMGGDPLAKEKLFMKAIRTLIAIRAAADGVDWKRNLENEFIDSFGDSLFISSPEIMLSVLGNCSWAPFNVLKDAKICIGTNLTELEVDGKMFLSVYREGTTYTTPEWLPYLLRHVCSNDFKKIDVQFYGAPVETLYERSNDLAKLLQSSDISKYNKMKFASRNVSHRYDGVAGTMHHSQQKPDRGTIVFAKFFRNPSTEGPRDIQDVIKTDFRKL